MADAEVDPGQVLGPLGDGSGGVHPGDDRQRVGVPARSSLRPGTWRSRLGATTLNLYAHMWPGDDDRIRQAVDRAFGSHAEDQLRTEGQAQ